MVADTRALPQFKVLKRGQKPPKGEHHILLVHRISRDRRALVHDISGHLPASVGAVPYMIGDAAFRGTPGDALRAADRMAAEYGAPFVYVRDDTGRD